MSSLYAHYYYRARKCPLACLLKLFCVGAFLFALNLALFHQTEVPHASYVILVASIGAVAMLALAVNRNCRLRNSESGKPG